MLDTDIPTKKSSLVCQSVGDNLLIYDPETDSMHTLNPTAAFIFELCISKHSVSYIAAELVSRFNVTESIANQDALRIIGEFEANKLIVLSQTINSDKGCLPGV